MAQNGSATLKKIINAGKNKNKQKNRTADQAVLFSL